MSFTSVGGFLDFRMGLSLRTGSGMKPSLIRNLFEKKEPRNGN